MKPQMNTAVCYSRLVAASAGWQQGETRLELETRLRPSTACQRHAGESQSIQMTAQLLNYESKAKDRRLLRQYGDECQKCQQRLQTTASDIPL